MAKRATTKKTKSTATTANKVTSTGAIVEPISTVMPVAANAMESAVVAESPAPTQSAVAKVESEVVAKAKSTSSLSHEEIARRAYELWLRRGATHGDPAADWLAAEAELRASCAA